MGEILNQLSFGLNQNRMVGSKVWRIELDPIGSFLLPENRDQRMGAGDQPEFAHRRFHFFVE